MEKKRLSLGHIRGLLVDQHGRCAITGRPLDPAKASGDHIIPLSRRELSPPDGPENIWLVDKQVNAMKGSLTYDELIQLSKEIIAYEATARALHSRIREEQITQMDKADFDKWVNDHCNDEGRIVD